MIETPSRILVVDDEPSITEFVSYALKKEGYETDVVDNGEDAFALASANNYDLFILDIMLPGMDGYELCRRLRSKTTAPVLFLSARDTELDKVVGLEIGGDDYLAKPFGVRELIARVRALLRRGQAQALLMQIDHGFRCHQSLTDNDGVTLLFQKFFQALLGAVLHRITISNQIRVLGQAAVGNGLLIGRDPLLGGGQTGQAADGA